MAANRNEGPTTTPFSEKGFYLGEFRGRTLAVTASADELGSPAPLREVIAELGANSTRVVLISDSSDALAGLIDTPIIPATAPRLEGVVWHGLRKASCVGVCVDSRGDFALQSAQIALRLGVTKLVWIDRDGVLLGDEGRRLSFVDLGELRKIRSADPGIATRRAVILREVESLLSAGMPAVNLCSLEGLADELFTYSGSGTLFSRERYVEVRRLGIDDFDAADDLIARGVAEGYLAPRSPEAVERVLANGFGAFVEGRHLAGIGALLHWEKAAAAEIASLYTVTRFVGEGIGGHLVAFACARARELECKAVTAVTTSDRVAAFFERNGFERVGADEIPAEKWQGYDPERRARAVCLRRVL
jgi:amino-acid N-acetyltransferase